MVRQALVFIGTVVVAGLLIGLLFSLLLPIGSSVRSHE